MKVVIIGGVAGGMSAAARLRRLDEHAEITVYEMSEHVSYANCGLPYFVSDVISRRDNLLLQTPAALFSRFRIKAHVQLMVTKINRAEKTIEVKNLQTGTTHTDNYDKLIISTGARPRKLDVPGIERAMWLRNVTDADAVKAALQNLENKSVAIIGAGFIGIELAENIRHLDIPVTIIQRSNSILGQFDPEMIQPLHARLQKHGVVIELNAQPKQITDTHVVLADGRKIDAGLVFTAAGVDPDNTLARDAGLKIGETGGLWVDDQQGTSDPDIFAAGDAVEKHGELTGNQTLIPLANLANRHGRLVADVIAGRNTKARNAVGTVIIGAFGLATGITGLSERAATKAGIKHQVIHIHPNNHAGYYPGSKRLSMKVLFDPATGKLLGAQAYGEDGVDKRLDVIATAMMGGLTIDDLMDLELAYAPQFGSAKDAINIAGYVGNNVFNGTTPTLQWHELEAARANGAQVIDVRSGGEHGFANIPGTINIPVDELRDRLAEVQMEDVVVYCQVGQRGHIATQILKAHGANVKNLSGGYLTWAAGEAALAK
ncbi:FAD-dependent oxidoreductase [Rhodoluna sp.]|uniref:FAD-dependent oxidoreductase n=1 Tax=Rhodoluna sp. TaxID=1969481 RepID=UPI0025DDB4E7|nr:FAD-dependent oxidoreductase [Rhodoluna sp.]